MKEKEHDLHLYFIFHPSSRLSFSHFETLTSSLVSSIPSLSASPISSLSPVPLVYFGRGDRKTTKGKRFNHSFGNGNFKLVTISSHWILKLSQLYPFEGLHNYTSGIIHHVQLNGLEPSTIYYYQCGDPSLQAMSKA
ncbi:hypothetical protein K1719_019957 [Acacia pycnantha]|nr:hypothetical protein K1719_019957 [Acacia pycnantha]